MSCLACERECVVQQLDLGSHPVSSFYLPIQNAKQTDVPIALGQCTHCGTLQLLNPVPHTNLIPPYDWLFAREPEDHLDDTVERILNIEGVNKDCVVVGLTSKDDTTIDRFRAKGFTNTWRLDPKNDLGILDTKANIETVQKLTTPDTMRAIAQKKGQANILIVRHILEHTENLRSFLEGIAELVAPDGIIILEVPDCTPSLLLNDYAMIWEEHSLYLTPDTFSPLIETVGFKSLQTITYPYAFENSLVQIAKKCAQSENDQHEPLNKKSHFDVNHYAKSFEPITTALRDYLQRYKNENGPIALFGAGHLACAFVNFHKLGDLIDFVADDTKQKQGLFLPGARLPILPSTALVEQGVKLCLLAVSITNEDNVISRNTSFIAQGGEFRSIFAGSPRSIRAHIHPSGN